MAKKKTDKKPVAKSAVSSSGKSTAKKENNKDFLEELEVESKPSLVNLYREYKAKFSKKIDAHNKKITKNAGTAQTHEVKQIKKPRHKTKHQSFRLTPPSFHDNSAIPNAFTLFLRSLKFIWDHPFSFTFFVFSYGVILYFVAPEALTSTNDVTYSGIITVIATLATIRLVRHADSNDYRGIRDAYYNGMAQLVPFLLIVIIFAVQTLPMAAGVFVYDTIINNQLAITPIEQYIPYALLLILSIPTLFWISSTMMAMYIVTLPGATPLRALQLSGELVNGRRFLVLRKIVTLFLIVGGLLVFLLWWFSENGWQQSVDIAPVIFYIIVIPISQVYLFKLYRSLLQ
ncbi:hypothetical protein KBC31_03090 [Candidatus Saccharibacteria bacterium]|jgi:hypothetical protein|nr:hypothetical protein [Candidatus Saccharibacteria bacterium]